MPTIADEPIRRHTFTVADYYRMADTGILGPAARVELVDGEIIDMPPIGSRHAGTVRQLSRILQNAVSDRAMLLIQDPVSLNDYSEPEPDIAHHSHRDAGARPRSRADLRRLSYPG
jgi:Uma2 family endonuclease